MRRTGERIAFVLVAVVLAGCGRVALGISKPTGAEGGACTSVGACDPGLVCLSKLCVVLGDSGGSVPAACESSTLGGIGVPDGTVTSASGSYPPGTPDAAVDGDLTNAWNSGQYWGWLRLDFPAPTTITGVHIAAFATPTTDETYTIAADSLSTPIGTATRRVPAGVVPSLLAPIPVTPGTYSSITITINGELSWVAIADLSLLTQGCPFVCGCAGRSCGEDGCGTNCGTCPAGYACSAGACI